MILSILLGSLFLRLKSEEKRERETLENDNEDFVQCGILIILKKGKREKRKERRTKANVKKVYVELVLYSTQCGGLCTSFLTPFPTLRKNHSCSRSRCKLVKPRVLCAAQNKKKKRKNKIRWKIRKNKKYTKTTLLFNLAHFFGFKMFVFQ